VLQTLILRHPAVLPYLAEQDENRQSRIDMALEASDLFI
jgi:hypothetical protein